MAETAKCPICKRVIASDAQWRPFCSARCRTVDLGSWLSESYRVAAASQDEEDDPGPPMEKDEEG